MAHQHGGRTCEHPTKKACEAARREAMGRCVELIASDKSGETSCRNWAVDRVNDRAVCGQHYLSIFSREREAEERARRKATLDAAIDAFMAGEPARIARVQTWGVFREIQASLTP